MITIVSFSSRKNGNCAQIASYIHKEIKNEYLFDFSDFELKPCGYCDYEFFSCKEACPHLDDMEHTILEAIC